MPARARVARRGSGGDRRRLGLDAVGGTAGRAVLGVVPASCLPVRACRRALAGEKPGSRARPVRPGRVHRRRRGAGARLGGPNRRRLRRPERRVRGRNLPCRLRHNASALAVGPAAPVRGRDPVRYGATPGAVDCRVSVRRQHVLPTAGAPRHRRLSRASRARRRQSALRRGVRGDGDAAALGLVDLAGTRRDRRPSRLRRALPVSLLLVAPLVARDLAGSGPAVPRAGDSSLLCIGRPARALGCHGRPLLPLPRGGDRGLPRRLCAAALRLRMTFDVRHPTTVRATILVAAIAPLLALRLHQAQPGFLYPDGYQYLLMAKGVAAHGRPFLTLGPGGDTLLPSVDAAAKPLYPALVALVHEVGVGWFDAARLVSAVGAAATVVLAALLARRLTGSWLAAAVAGGGCVASRELAFWGGFAGPDSLGQAFALGSTLALLGRRVRLGAPLAALAVLARPELAVLAVVAAIVGIAFPELRQAALRAGLSFIVVLAAGLTLLRPPIGAPPLGPSVALGALALLTTVVCVIGKRVGTGGVGWLVVGGLLAVVPVAVLLGQAAGTRRWFHDDWPLLL